MGWQKWPFARVVILFSSLGFLLIFFQVTLMHYRQNFRDLSQWVPVIALPILAFNALLLTFWNVSWLHTLFLILNWVGLLAGFGGFYKHFRGVGQRVDGYRLHNFLVGPPVILPLLISANSALALLALYWS